MVINLVSGIYYNLTGSAAAVWPLLTGGVPLHVIADRVRESFQGHSNAIESDLAKFADALAGEAIVRAAKQVENAIANSIENRADVPLPVAPYTGFTIGRYDDMRALLVVDPVHEVGDFGWPSSPEPPSGTAPPK